MEIFNYVPSEKIVINTYDAADFGFGAATTVPQNFIRFEIEPFESGYENVPFNDPVQWILSHELVHIVINDQATDAESFFRSIFSKVAPEQAHPVTVFYSLLTNFSRYTPRWHQEAIAVLFETYFSGGWGRMLGNFDEMYFRSMVLENKEFPTYLSLDTKSSHNSFLLETLFYLYGTRFSTYLIVNYGPDKFIKWFTAGEDDFYGSFIVKFENVYSVDFDKAWKDFISFEKDFQQGNISRLTKYKTSAVKSLPGEDPGWVTQPYIIQKDSSVIYGLHKPHHLANIQLYSLEKSTSKELASLPTPSILQVASTAYDSSSNLFFYTTNNNQLFRDIWALDVNTGEKKMILPDCRIGDITVSPANHELWGIQHDGGRASLVYSEYPYNAVIPVISFPAGDEIFQLSADPAGKFMAAVLHRANGEQSLILVNTDSLKNGHGFKFQTITNSGTPENPSWSPDGKYIYWNAYVNGVSNIYRINLDNADAEKEALSHTLRGLFKPVYLSADSLFVFEFTSDGFVPAVIPNKPAEYLPAIEYLGQRVSDNFPELEKWALKNVRADSIEVELIHGEEPYSGFSNLKLQTFIPEITGFQSQKVLGFYTHIADPLLYHDLTLELGISPFNENPAGPKFHFRGRYEFKKRYDFGVEYNATDFYDLFNDRKRGVIGTRLRFGHSHYWLFDNPLKMKQNTEIAVYTDYEYINDNLVRVSEPDFFVAQTNFNSKNSRRSIGSSDFESGQELNATIMVFGSDPKDPAYATQVFSDFSHMDTWIAPHNVFHLKLGAGYHFKNERLFQAKFFFGGFGNRALENVDFKQYRSLFRFPGIPIYSLPSEKFIKILLENNFPPIRFANAGIGQQYLNHIDFSVYTQGMLTKSDEAERWVDIGAQVNFILKHWFNLESTFSAGIAQAWSEHSKSWEWFISYKLLRN
ncbi:MAG: hypothetical protein R6W90_07455 [Ignavibacteriaceae bacterium]